MEPDKKSTIPLANLQNLYLLLRIVVLGFVVALTSNALLIRRTGDFVFFPTSELIRRSKEDLLSIDYFNEKSKVIYYIVVLAYFFAYTFILDVGRWLIVHFYRRRKSLPARKTDNYIMGIMHIERILLSMGIVALLFALFDLSFKEVLTSMAIFAAAIAILTKEYLTNLINGMLFTFSNQIEIDDSVKIGKHNGKVRNISMVHVQLINEDDDVVYIPNNYVYANDFINYTRDEVRKTSIDFHIRLRYVPSIEHLENSIKEKLKPFMAYIEAESVVLKTEEIWHTHLEMKFQFTLITPNKQRERELRRLVNRHIVEYIAARRQGLVK